MNHQQMMNLMIKTGTSKNDLMFNCGASLTTINSMMSDKIKVNDSIILYLNTRRESMDET